LKVETCPQPRKPTEEIWGIELIPETEDEIQFLRTFFMFLPTRSLCFPIPEPERTKGLFDDGRVVISFKVGGLDGKTK